MANFEIERKWTLEGGKPNVLAPFKEEHVVYQWYIAVDTETQVRISQRKEPYGDRYTLNIKNGNGLSRKEVRIDITYKDFLELIAQCDVETAPIKKHLYVYYLPFGHELEVSQVDDDWWYSEVEFRDEAEAAAFNAEPYFEGCTVVDRTGDSTYAMKNYWKRTREGRE